MVEADRADFFALVFWGRGRKRTSGFSKHSGLWASRQTGGSSISTGDTWKGGQVVIWVASHGLFKYEPMRTWEVWRGWGNETPVGKNARVGWGGALGIVLLRVGVMWTGEVDHVGEGCMARCLKQQGSGATASAGENLPAGSGNCIGGWDRSTMEQGGIARCSWVHPKQSATSVQPCSQPNMKSV